MSASTAAIGFHDAECGGYSADLSLWGGLAAARPEHVVDLGCGTGRVALYLAARGARVTAVDHDPSMTAELGRRAGAAGLEVRCVASDAVEHEPDPAASLVIAPMQLVQLLDADRCGRLIDSVAGGLAPGGLLGLAVTTPEGLQEFDLTSERRRGDPSPLPDVRELDGWIYSSLPIAVRQAEDSISIVRLRQAVSPAGELTEQREETRLALHDPAWVERVGIAAGLEPRERREVPSTPDHAGAAVVLLERRSEGVR